MKQIIVEPQNPLDHRPEDLEPLLHDLAEIGPDFEVLSAHAFDDESAGVTFWEVLHVYLTWSPIAGPVLQAMVTASVKFLRSRFQKYPTRPKSLTIYGPDNHPLKVIVLRHAKGEVEEGDINETHSRYPPIR